MYIDQCCCKINLQQQEIIFFNLTNNSYLQTRQTREVATKGLDNKKEGSNDNSNTIDTVEKHLKGIHETMKGIQKEVEGMRKDVISINQNRNSSPTESGSESQSSKGKKTKVYIKYYFQLQ